MRFEAWIYDQNNVRQGSLPLLSASATIRRNAVSSFIVDADTSSPEFIPGMKGWFIRLCDEYGVEVGGIVTSISHSLQDGVRATSFNCETFEVYLQRMISLPSPDQALTNQGDYYRDRGKTEDVLRRLIYTHIGNGARDFNQAGVLVAESQGRGNGTRIIKTRFKNLLEVAQNISVNDGELMFETHLSTQGLPRFRFRMGEDLRREVRLSEANGALGSWEMEETAPEVTRVLVAGQGQGADRTLVLRAGNSNDYAPGTGLRGTVFQDRRDTDGDDDLTQAGDDTLADGAETAKISMELNDVPGNRFGEDFQIGDRVTVQLLDGMTIQDVVQSASIDWGESGRSVSIHVGSTLEDPDENDPALLRRVRKLTDRLNSLEAQ